MAMPIRNRKALGPMAAGLMSWTRTMRNPLLILQGALSLVAVWVNTDCRAARQASQGSTLNRQAEIAVLTDLVKTTIGEKHDIYGAERRLLQIDLEGRLRRMGFRVVSPDDHTRYLYVHLDISPFRYSSGATSIVYYTEVYYKQPANSPLLGDIPVSVGLKSTHDRDGIDDFSTVQGEIGKIVDEFILKIDEYNKSLDEVVMEVPKYEREVFESLSPESLERETRRRWIKPRPPGTFRKPPLGDDLPVAKAPVAMTPTPRASRRRQDT